MEIAALLVVLLLVLAWFKLIYAMRDSDDGTIGVTIFGGLLLVLVILMIFIAVFPDFVTD